MNQLSAARSWAWVLLGLSFAAAGCVVAAAGAGAGGGIYFTKRGVESVVPVGVERTFEASKRAFDHFKIRQTKLKAEDEDQDEDKDKDEGEKRELGGETKDRTVTVTLHSEGKGSTKVRVVARKSAVTWDKDFARAVLEKIVAYSR